MQNRTTNRASVFEPIAYKVAATRHRSAGTTLKLGFGEGCGGELFFSFFGGGFVRSKDPSAPTSYTSFSAAEEEAAAAAGEDGGRLICGGVLRCQKRKGGAGKGGAGRATC
jgi:hypothetical protein